MATKEYHKVSLYRETATLTDESITPGAPSGTLKLGASGNFGVHTLQVELGEGWQGLTVHAIFWLSGEGVLGNSLLSGGEISVPAAVTASSTNVGFVTFSGTSSGVNRLTATLPFIVTDGPPSEGEPSPDPDPSLWQQLFDKMAEVVSTYILPIMSEETLGGGRAIKKTTETVPVAVDPLDGRLYVPDQSGSGGGDYKLPQATETTLGGVKAKQRTTETLEVAIDEATGKLYVQQQGGGGSYVLPVATEGVLGGVKAPAKTSETVKVVVDADGFLYIKDYAEKSSIPTKVSQLQNDSNFLTKESDPTVPTWAKQPNKPTYTADEVGAQAKGDYVLKNEIPTKLPNPQKLTFTGAVNKTYDGSSAVTVNIPTGGGGGEFDINTATPSFTEAESRENINTGETIPILFGKIKKWFTDLKAVAFSGNYNDLAGQPQALKNPQAITFTGAVSETYDGSEAKTINIPTGGTGTTDYNALSNKPSIGGVTIEGNKTAADYGLAAKEELPKQATDTVAGIAKFQPIAEQGDNVPASILPDGTVVVPSGGTTTGEQTVLEYTTLAKGTIEAGQTAVDDNSLVDTKISLDDLREWRIFIIRIRLDDGRPYLTARFGSKNIFYSVSNAVFTLCTWLDSEKNVLGAIGGVGNSTQSNPDTNFIGAQSLIGSVGTTGPIQGVMNVTAIQGTEVLKVGIGHMNGLDTTKYSASWDVVGVIKYK